LIDVIMLTRNSNKPYFRRVLRAVKEKIPVHHFIVVDGHSTDGTVETVKEFFGSRVKVIRTTGTLGYARLLGLMVSDTEWVVFVDSDVEILDGYDVAKPLTRNPRIWGIQGVFVDETTKALLSNRDIEVVHDIGRVNIKILLKYGFYRLFGADTGYVYLRRKVVETIDPHILSQLDSGEDLYIAQEIIRKGFLYIRTESSEHATTAAQSHFQTGRSLPEEPLTPTDLHTTLIQTRYSYICLQGSHQRYGDMT